MSQCVLCVLEFDTLLKCKECSFECCGECIKDWYTKRSYGCPQCRRLKTFDIIVDRNSDQWNNILAAQNFLDAIPQIGVDTVLSHRGRQSSDIRGDIPNPINVVNPWNIHCSRTGLGWAENAPTFIATSLLPRPNTERN